MPPRVWPRIGFWTRGQNPAGAMTGIHSVNEKSTVIRSNGRAIRLKKLSFVRTARAIRSEAQNAIRQNNCSTILTNDFAKKQLSR